jgi:filamentous hemagglutinin family protein
MTARAERTAHSRRTRTPGKPSGLNVPLRTCAATMVAAGLLSVPGAAQPQSAPQLPQWRMGSTNPLNTNIAAPNRGNVQITQQTAQRMDLTQGTERAVVNWYSFNIGAGNTVNINQPNFSSALLNRVGSGDPTRIAGSLNANGQVYIINRNGLVFQNGASVKVGGLTASALDVNDDRFMGGLLPEDANAIAQFALPDGLTEEQARAAIVSVQGGAQIAAARGGRVFLFGTQVSNEGTIVAPEGQVALAAGGRIYLAQPEDTRLRNLLVEVDPAQFAAADGSTATLNGIARNGAGGNIETLRGNTTMVAYAVNQDGRISATNAVQQDGSILLLARDSTSVPFGTTRVANRTGVLTLGAGSVTEVLPDTVEGAPTDAQGRPNYSSAETTEDVRRARIELNGREVQIGQQARVVARAGDIDVTAAPGATADPGAAAPSVRVEAGAMLDVSGLRDVQRSVRDHELEVELRGFELADAPQQREGILRTRGQETFFFDARSLDADGRVPLANLAGYRDQVGQRIDEASTTGGNLRIQSSGGNVTLARGATLDVSGGSVNFASGKRRVTMVRDQFGREFDINSAPSELTYVSYRTVERTEAGYVQGANAGTIDVRSGAGAVTFDATLKGDVIAGLRQRDVAGTADRARPLAGALSLNTSRDVAIGGGGGTGGAGSIALDAGVLAAGGFRELSVDTNGSGSIGLSAEARLALADGGRANLSGRGINIDGTIDIAGGSVNLTSTTTAAAASGPLPGINIGSAARINTAGRWTNDDLAGPAADNAIVNNGGSVSLRSVGDVTVANGARIDVSAGARLAGGRVTAGNAGSIALVAGVRSSTVPEADGAVTVNGQLLGAAIARDGFSADRSGGSLEVRATRVSIDGAAGGVGADGGITRIGADTFATGGFQSFTFGGIERLDVQSGAVVEARPQFRQLGAGFQRAATGSDLAAFTQNVSIDADQRTASRVSLSAGSGNSGPAELNLHAGSYVAVNAGGRVDLNSARQITIAGTVVAPGGSVNVASSIDRPFPLAVGEQFNPGRSIFLAETARIDVDGKAVFDPRPQPGRVIGRVLNGGRVSFASGDGWIVMQPNARITARGASASIDVGQAGTRQQRTTVESNGGSISFESAYGMWIDGRFDARGGGAGAANGSLRIAQQSGFDPLVFDGAPDAGRAAVVRLQQSIGKIPASATFVAGVGSVSDPSVAGPVVERDIGIARVSAQTINEGGFDDVTLSAGTPLTARPSAPNVAHAIEFSGNVDLRVRGNLVLDAPNLQTGGGRQRLEAATITLGDPNGVRPRTINESTTPAPGETLPSLPSSNLAAPTSGFGTLDVRADSIDLVGDMRTQGFGRIDLQAQGDIALRGVAGSRDTGERTSGGNAITEPNYVGSFVTGADLNLSARVIYPTTGARFELSVDGAARPDGTVRFNGNGATPNTPLSAGGELTVRAPNIVQAGALFAPFGAISLDAGNTVTLAAGSTTSVSGDGATLLYGQTRLTGREWFYDFSRGTTTSAQDRLAVDAVPGRRVSINGAVVDLQDNAVVDLRGGGDLLSTEFVAGPGGSRNLFADPNVYAIVPSYSGNRAPSDFQASRESNLRAGERIELLDAADGLAAGSYTLLPARYALTDPNARLVMLRPNSTDFSAAQTQQLADGTTLVAGRRFVEGAGGQRMQVDSRTQAFQVASVDWGRARSEILETRASTVFDMAGAPRVADAGQLSLRIGNSLALGATVRADAAPGGARALVDISADRLAVTSAGSGSVVPAGTVAVLASDVNALNAGSVLLGGTRTIAADGTQIIDTQSQQLSVDSGAALSGTELILTARDEVRVRAGASVAATPSAASDAAATPSLLTNGEGALLRVAGGPQADYVRENAQSGGGAGALVTEAGARVAGRSVILDATRDNRSEGALEIASGGALALAASRISAGSVAGPVDGLTLTPQFLTSLGQAEDLRLKSYTTLDLYGAATLGSATTRRLEIEAGTVRGLNNADQRASLQAQTVSLSNPDGTAAAPAAGAPAGSGLDIVAGAIELGRGAVSIDGFTDTSLRASDAVRATANGSLTVTGGLETRAAQLGADADARYQIAAGGDINIGRGNAAAASAAAGGTLSIDAGTRLNVGGTVRANSGELRLSGRSGVAVLDGGVVDASGFSTQFADKSVAAPAGTVNIASAQGDVALQAGSTVSVAGVAGGDAGRVELSAVNGTVSLAGTLVGAAVAADGQSQAPQQGQLSIDARTLPGFAAIAGAAAQGGFTDTLELRQRNGDLRIDADVRASRFVASADNGGIEVSRTIDASERAGGPARGGTVDLYARGDSAVAADSAGGLAGRVIVTGTGRILAAATTTRTDAAAGSEGRGGLVVLGAAGAGSDKIVIATGARIDVSTPDGSAQSGGSVSLRAPRTDDGTGIQIARVDGEITTGNGGVVIVEGVRTYEASVLKQRPNSGPGVTPDAPGTLYVTGAPDSIDAGNQVLAANVAAIDAALFGANATLNRSIRPGVEVVSSGNLTVAASTARTTTTGPRQTNNSVTLETLRYADNASGLTAAPGTLSLRAVGSVNFDVSLSDGYTTRTIPSGTGVNAVTDTSARSTDALRSSGDSWSYRVAAGADVAAADPLATTAGAAGDVRLANGAFVRTGAGSIDIAAARDVLIGRSASIPAGAVGTELRNSAIFAAGVADTPLDAQFPASATTISGVAAEFGRRAGDVRVRAGGNVGALPGSEVSTYYGNWFYRQGDFTQGTPSGVSAGNRYLGWWARTRGFDQGIASFGGGDVTVAAGGNVQGLTFASVGNARQAVVPAVVDVDSGQIIEPARFGAFVEQGGGNVAVHAANDVRGTTMVTTRGDIDVRAGGAVGESAVGAAGANGAPLLAVGAGSASVVGRNTVEVQTVFNTTLGAQSTTNVGVGINSRRSYFSTYETDSSFDALSISGDVVLRNTVISPTPQPFASSTSELMTTYPGRVQIAALSGDIDVRNAMNLYPSVVGQLDLLAAGAIDIRSPVVQSDLDPTGLPTRTNPHPGALSSSSSPQSPFLPIVRGQVDGPQAHAASILHANDREGSRVIARDGSITGSRDRLALGLAESVTVEAGGDIVYLRLIAQNVRPEDVTRVVAGGSISYPTLGDEIRSNVAQNEAGVTVRNPANVGIEVGGPGQVQVLAGGDISLGDAGGVVTRGNLNNPFLPTGGATIVVLAGTTQLDTAGYAAYLNAPERALTREVLGFDRLLADYLVRFDPVRFGDVAADRPLERLALLTAAERDVFYLNTYFALLREIGDQAQSSGRKGLYFAGYEAMSYLFADSENGKRYAQLISDNRLQLGGPADALTVSGDVTAFFDGLTRQTTQRRANVDLFFSQVSTDQNGSVFVLAPDGGINVGLENNPPALTGAKRASELGVLARREGAVYMLGAGSIAVNQSRVFSLGGGELVLASLLRDVDAGRGQKTANATPPADVTLVDDFLVQDLSNAISGAGIAALRGRADVPDANVALIAPIGVVDAGDAGVRSTGRTLVAAETVRNAQNIAASGGLSGTVAVPPGAPPTTAAPAPSPADGTRGETGGSRDRSRDGNRNRSVFTAEIVGSGELDCTLDANRDTEECRLRRERETQERKTAPK